jgi:hypothetical protein
MPYKDPDQRRQAARKWRAFHRAERAAYMRRYRKARSTGRPRGRPRSKDLPAGAGLLAAEAVRLPQDRRMIAPADAGRAPDPVLPLGPGPAETPPDSIALEKTELPPSTSAGMPWDTSFLGARM